MIEAADSLNGTISHTYDQLDRLTSVITPQGTVNYTFDTVGRRASMTVTGQPTVTYTYDNADHLIQLTQGTSNVVFGYNAAGRRTSITLPDGLAVEYAYDAAWQLTGITYKFGANTIGGLIYEYDHTGSRTKMTGGFARIALPQILGSAGYDAANQLTQWGGNATTHDLNGSLTYDGTTTYTWNARNQLSSMSGPSVTASFQYDALGRRQSRTVNGTTTAFLYDGDNVVQELFGGAPSVNLLTGFALDEVLRRTDSMGSRTPLRDALSSTVAMVDSAGGIQTEYTYEPFGKATSTGATSANTLQYTGRENDGTGLYYYRFRYYHPGLQRFISEDPIEFRGGDFNLYSYTANDPVTDDDPYGLQQRGPGGGRGIDPDIVPKPPFDDTPGVDKPWTPNRLPWRPPPERTPGSTPPESTCRVPPLQCSERNLPDCAELCRMYPYLCAGGPSLSVPSPPPPRRMYNPYPPPAWWKPIVDYWLNWLGSPIPFPWF